MTCFSTVFRRLLLNHWGILLFALFLLLLLIGLKMTTPLTFLLLFLISAFVFASVTFPVKTRRLWLIPMFLLLPLICIPGELAVISCVPEWSRTVLEWLIPLNSSLVSPFPSWNALLTIWIGSAWAVWLLWVLYICWRGTTPRHSTIRFFNILLISLVLWCFALGFQTIRASNSAGSARQFAERNYSPRTTRDGRNLSSLIRESATLKEKMLRKYPKFAPPCCGVYPWTTRNRNASPSELREREEIIRATLASWNAPEVRRFFDSLDRYASQRPFQGHCMIVNNDFFSLLNSLRSFARYQRGRAEVALHQGRTKEILPPLESITAFDEALQEDVTSISQLVRCAIFFIQVDGVIQLGPTAPDYAGVYRRMLETVQKWRVSAPVELELLLSGLQNRISRINRIPERFQFLDFGFPFPAALLLRPLELTVRTTLVKHAVAARKLIPLLDSVQRFPLENGWIPFLRHLEDNTLPEIDWDALNQTKDPELSFVNPDSQKVQMIRNYAKFLCAKNLAETGIALKLYKCLHGAYPETTHALLPEILKTLPRDPYTGKPFVYRLENGEFSLISGNPLIRLHSKAEY